MKTSFQIAALTVVSSFLFTACTPADKPVTSKDVRFQIQSQNARKAGKRPPAQSGGNSTARGPRIGFFSIASLLLDKEVEAIEVYRLAANIDNGGDANTRLTVEDGVVTGISTDPAKLSYSTTQGDFVGKSGKNLKVELSKEEGFEGSVLKVTAANLRQSVDKMNAGKTYANLFEDNYSVMAAKSQTEKDVIVITLEAAGKMEISVDGQKASENYKLKVLVKADAASLEAKDVKVLSSTATLTLIKEGKKNIDVTIEGKNHGVNMDGLCNTLVGSSKIMTDRKQKSITATDKEVSVEGSTFKTTIAECNQRPTVDISRLLLF